VNICGKGRGVRTVDAMAHPENSTRSRVFISHSEADKEFASRLRNDLVRRGLDVLDASSGEYGESVSASVARAIGSSDTVAVLLSRAASQSDWVAREIALALSPQSSDQPKRVIPLLIEVGAEPPPFITDLRWVDVSSPAAYERNINGLVEALKHPSPPTLAEAERTLSARKQMIEAESESLRVRSSLAWDLVAASNRRFEQLMVPLIAGSLAVGVGVAGYALFHSRILVDIGEVAVGVLAGFFGTTVWESWVRRGRK
jgi:hypothetical protein